MGGGIGVIKHMIKSICSGSETALGKDTLMMRMHYYDKFKPLCMVGCSSAVCSPFPCYQQRYCRPECYRTPADGFELLLVVYSRLL